MYNFMYCNQMMFGSDLKNGITYKTNQNSFEVYSRKYYHNFCVPTVQNNMEGSKGLDLKTMNAFLITKVDEIIMYDSDTF